MSQYTVDVMIPTYKPGQEFAELLPRLLKQTYPIRSIRVVNTGKKFWNPAWEQLSDKIMVEHIQPSEFDHGGTRRAMAESSDADLLLFMTQDAMPYDNACVEHLVEKFSLPHVKAAYARQLPRDDCRTLERFTRGFNYPDESDIKDAGDLPKLGVKTFFCSNVCAMYDRRTYEELGGFVERRYDLCRASCAGGLCDCLCGRCEGGTFPQLRLSGTASPQFRPRCIPGTASGDL